MSIRYLVPEPVVQYIEEHNLYDDDGLASESAKGKEKEQLAGESKGVADVGVNGEGSGGG